VKGREFEYFQEKGLKYDKWSEMKGFWSTEEMEYFHEQGFESNKWSEVKWRELKKGQDQLKAMKGRELRRGGMWSVCNDCEVEWGVGLGEMCVIEYCIVWFTHC